MWLLVPLLIAVKGPLYGPTSVKKAPSENFFITIPANTALSASTLLLLFTSNSPSPVIWLSSSLLVDLSYSLSSSG